MSDSLEIEREREELEAEALYLRSLATPSPIIDPAMVVDPPQGPDMLSQAGDMALAPVQGIADSFINFPSRLYDTAASVLTPMGEAMAESMQGKGVSGNILLDTVIGGGGKIGQKVRSRFENQSVPQSISDVANVVPGFSQVFGPPIETAADFSDEYRGLAAPTTAAEKIRKLADMYSSGLLVPRVGAAGLRTVNRLVEKPLARAVGGPRKTAMDYAEGEGLSGDSLATQVKIANADAAALENSIGNQLGAVTRGSAKDAAAGIQLRRGIAQLEKSGVMDDIRAAKSIDEIVDLAARTDDATNGLREQALQRLPQTPPRAGEFAPIIRDLRLEAVKLAKNPKLTGDMAAGIQETILDFADDMQRASTPQDMSDIFQNINKARRLKAEEFNSAKQMAQNAGDVPKLGKIEGSIKALDKLQQGISEALDVRAGAKPGQGPFTEINATQSAVKALEQQAKLFGQRMQNARTINPENIPVEGEGGTKMAPVMGSGPAAQVSALSAALRWLKGSPSPRAAEILKLQGMSGNIGPQISRLTSLNANPARPPMTIKDLAGPQALGAAGSLARIGAQQQAPNAPMQPLPRTTEFITQNPQAILQRAFQMSGGNQQLLQDLQVVLSEQNPTKKRMALMEFSKMLPGLFVASPFKSEWDGQIQDKEERDLFADELERLQRKGEVDPTFLAKQLSALNADGTILPRPQPVQMPGPNQAINAGPGRYPY